MIKEIENLKHGECFIVKESDYGKAEIYRLNDVYLLFEIPLFGGVPVLHDTYSLHQIEFIKKSIESWT